MSKPSKRILKGWAFDRTLPTSLGRIRVTGFFRHRSQAEQLAARYMGPISVLRATLTLESGKPAKKNSGAHTRPKGNTPSRRQT